MTNEVGTQTRTRFVNICHQLMPELMRQRRRTILMASRRRPQSMCGLGVGEAVAATPFFDKAAATAPQERRELQRPEQPVQRRRQGEDGRDGGWEGRGEGDDATTKATRRAPTTSTRKTTDTRTRVIAIFVHPLCMRL